MPAMSGLAPLWAPSAIAACLSLARLTLLHPQATSDGVYCPVTPQSHRRNRCIHSSPIHPLTSQRSRYTPPESSGVKRYAARLKQFRAVACCRHVWVHFSLSRHCWTRLIAQKRRDQVFGGDSAHIDRAAQACRPAIERRYVLSPKEEPGADCTSITRRPDIARAVRIRC
jgi:hypothetical protein